MAEVVEDDLVYFWNSKKMSQKEVFRYACVKIVFHSPMIIVSKFIFLTI